MSVSNLFKNAGKVAVIAGGMVAGSALAAQADCSVSDANQRGFFGDKTWSRTFSGNSVSNIWNRYCMPFIKEKIATENITEGKFGMHCTGSLRCDIEGVIVNGRPQLRREHGLK